MIGNTQELLPKAVFPVETFDFAEINRDIMLTSTQVYCQYYLHFSHRFDNFKVKCSGKLWKSMETKFKSN